MSFTMRHAWPYKRSWLKRSTRTVSCQWMDTRDALHCFLYQHGQKLRLRSRSGDRKLKWTYCSVGAFIAFGTQYSRLTHTSSSHLLAVRPHRPKITAWTRCNGREVLFEEFLKIIVRWHLRMHPCRTDTALFRPQNPGWQRSQRFPPTPSLHVHCFDSSSQFVE